MPAAAASQASIRSDIARLAMVRNMVNRIVSHARFSAFLASLAAVALALFLTPSAKAPASQAKHGLTGSYYVANLGWENDVPPPPGSRPVYWSQVWVNNNDFKLPRTFTAPAASRVDPQIAFGQGKGFSAKANSPRVIWWPTGLTVPEIWQGNELAAGGIYVAAVIWKGYIHLPKAGTYYFGTVSDAPSAVYLNQARVALNGNYAPGVLVSDAFSYAKEEVQDFIQNFCYGREEVAFRPHAPDKYVVPVPIDGPRDLPIEVQYDSSERGPYNPLGIDLFWVTPDAPRDANGKPIARIVPADALYTEPPGTIERPAVRSANSTIEADHLYFPTEYGEEAVGLKIRLADKDGNPVASKRVHVNSLVSYGYADSIVQPEKPTDEKGETTAKIQPNKVGHDSTILATDVTDLVDVGQLGHVSFVENLAKSFFPNTFSPYYDGKLFVIEPLPMRAGRPLTIKVPVQNQIKSAAELSVAFEVLGANIGGVGWREIGRVRDVHLRPDERREISITWTPQKESEHLCFRVTLYGHLISASLATERPLAAAMIPPGVALHPLLAASGGDSNLGSVQQNVGPVAPTCPIQPPNGPPLGPFEGYVYVYGKPFLFIPRIVRIHSGPDVATKWTGRVPNGTYLKYEGSVRGEDGQDWYYVNLPGGPAGWIPGEDVFHYHGPLPTENICAES